MILQRDGTKKLEGDFEKWLMSYDISYLSKHPKKSLYEAVEIIVSKFILQPLRRGETLIDKLNVKTQLFWW
jgi:hypothetical protein